jgi:hypothetical protein
MHSSQGLQPVSRGLRGVKIFIGGETVLDSVLDPSDITHKSVEHMFKEVFPTMETFDDFVPECAYEVRLRNGVYTVSLFLYQVIPLQPE